MIINTWIRFWAAGVHLDMTLRRDPDNTPKAIANHSSILTMISPYFQLIYHEEFSLQCIRYISPLKNLSFFSSHFSILDCYH